MLTEVSGNWIGCGEFLDKSCFEVLWNFVGSLFDDLKVVFGVFLQLIIETKLELNHERFGTHMSLLGIKH